MSITYQSQDTNFSLKNRRLISQWIKTVIAKHNKQLGNVSYIFCSNSFILDLNQKYLNHNYFTDIITFDYCSDNIIEGDIFISVDTVKDNSTRFNTNFNDELLRVIIHGVLHLIGFNDKTTKQQKQMRSMEDEALSIYYNNAD
ncbi:MAG: rRNA maturation RNase YbeY [Bacteroidales bacterium]|nr:rRNA maturation RNase YbeY [Bacteroidales bacterium]